MIRQLLMVPLLMLLPLGASAAPPDEHACDTRDDACDAAPADTPLEVGAVDDCDEHAASICPEPSVTARAATLHITDGSAPQRDNDCDDACDPCAPTRPPDAVDRLHAALTPIARVPLPGVRVLARARVTAELRQHLLEELAHAGPTLVRRVPAQT